MSTRIGFSGHLIYKQLYLFQIFKTFHHLNPRLHLVKLDRIERCLAGVQSLLQFLLAYRRGQPLWCSGRSLLFRQTD